MSEAERMYNKPQDDMNFVYRSSKAVITQVSLVHTKVNKRNLLKKILKKLKTKSKNRQRQQPTQLKVD